MPIILNKRDAHLIEEMDKKDCEQVKLHNTYRQFRSINRLVSRWRGVYTRHIKPFLSPHHTTSILDIGFGGGDVPVFLHHLAQNDGLKLSITGIETDERTLEFTRSLDLPESITFEVASTTDMIAQAREFDIVISNHLLHHLQDDEIVNLCREAEQLCQRRVIFNDIERGDLAWAFFTVTGLFYHRSFITKDGLTSIRRSFTLREIRNILPEEWSVERLLPYRIVATYDTQ